jgi:hypothetical protein
MGFVMAMRQVVRIARDVVCIAVFIALAAGTAFALESTTRFGDSTWVAPTAAAARDTVTPGESGPRVAPPDHEPRAETALRLPFRAAFLPFRLLARGTEATVGRLGGSYLEPHPPAPPTKRSIHIAPTVTYSGTSSLGGGISVVARNPVGTGSKISVAGTWSLNDNRRVTLRSAIGQDVTFVGGRLDFTYDFIPNRRFYGIGNSSDPSRRSIYLREEGRLDGAITIARRPYQQLRLVAGYSDISARRGYRGHPLIDSTFTPAELPFLHRGSQVISYGLAGDIGLLDNARDPSRGFHLRGDGRINRSTDQTDIGYFRWHLEGRAYAPVFAARRVVALRVVYQGVDPTSSSEPVPYYRLPTSDREARFAGYKSGRFTDSQLLLAHVEYRWIIWRRSWVHALYEWGEVAPNWNAFTIPAAHRSYGGGIRYSTGPRNAILLDIAKGSEGFEAYLDFTGDF